MASAFSQRRTVDADTVANTPRVIASAASSVLLQRASATPVSAGNAQKRLAISDDDSHAEHPGLDQDLLAATAVPPRPPTLARPSRGPRALPSRLRLRRRDPARRRSPTPVSAALCRLRPRLGLRDLPGQPRRLRAQRPTYRRLRRARGGCPRHRLRPLPQRPHPMDLTTPEGLTGETTSWRESRFPGPGGSLHCDGWRRACAGC